MNRENKIVNWARNTAAKIFGMGHGTERPSDILSLLVVRRHAVVEGQKKHSELRGEFKNDTFTYRIIWYPASSVVNWKIYRSLVIDMLMYLHIYEYGQMQVHNHHISPKRKRIEEEVDNYLAFVPKEFKKLINNL